jgi:esterase/lipase superfamily enzyme
LDLEIKNKLKKLKYMGIYIISNRHIVENKKGEKQFSNEKKQNALPTFRIAECNISSDNKKIGYKIIEDIDDPDYNKVFEVIEGKKEINYLGGTEYMFYDLYKSMKNDIKPNSDVLFFIHGFATSHEDELEHILKLKELYIDSESSIEHLIYLSWPTSNSYALTYWSDKEDSIVTGQTLARIYVKMNNFFYTMFKKYEQENCKQKIHIMAHSMGNQVLKQMMGNLNEKYIVPFIGEIILVHSDVSSNSFEKEQPFTKLHKLGQRTHIYIHKGDDALTISTTTKNFSKRLGKAGPSNIQDLSQSTFIVDVTGIKYDKLKKTGFLSKLKNNLVDHWGYMVSSQQVNDIIEILNGADERRVKNRMRHDIYPNYFYLNSNDIVEKI